jgi:hypothetical protein
MAQYLGADMVELPLMQPEITIDYALDYIPSLQQPVVVVEAGNSGLLMHEPMLRQSRGRGIRLLGKVPGGYPVPFLSYGEAAATRSNLRGPRQLDMLFSRHPSHLVLAVPSPITAMLVTAPGSQAHGFSGFGYQCNGRKPNGRPHYFPRPFVNDGDCCPAWPECDIDGTRTIVSHI